MRAQSSAPRTGEPADTRDGITYAELLNLAHGEGLRSLKTELLLTPSVENGRLCIVRATVETERGHFEGLGDADPGSVEEFIAPHLIRVAETRAKARALRDAVNIGVVSREELDGVGLDRSSDPGPGATRSPRHARQAPLTPPRSHPSHPAPAGSNGSPEPITEGQRRYLFRIMSSQGFYKEGAEERLKDLFRVQSLAEITKAAATQMIDQLLQSAAPGNGGGNGSAARSLC